jgi:hypothetical protein
LFGAAGFFLSVLAPTAPLALAGFVMIGLGASNVVPILFTAAGNQHAMPASLAIAAVTTLGYVGILAGPALIGFVAHASSLNRPSAAWLRHAADRRQRQAGRGGETGLTLPDQGDQDDDGERDAEHQSSIERIFFSCFK